MNSLFLTHPADRTTVHTTGAEAPPAYLVDRAIPATSEAAVAYIAGEADAGVYLARIVADLAQPGELAARVGVSQSPCLAGFLARIEKVLRVHLREVRA